MINAFKKNADISVRYQIPQDHGCQKFFAYGNTDKKMLIWMSSIIYHKTTAAKIQLLPYMLALEFKGLTSIELFAQTDITDITFLMSHRPIFQLPNLPNCNCNYLTYTWIPVSSVGVSVPELRLYGPTLRFVAWPRNQDLAPRPSVQLPCETAYW